ncbi:MAG: transposase family protein [Bacteroidota bacterium]
MIAYQKIKTERQFKASTGKGKKEFPPSKDWFVRKKVLLDLGFIGFEKTYNVKELLLGERKKRRSKKNLNPTLTPEQKKKNKEISKERIFLEHAIGRMKIYRMLRNKCRIKTIQLQNRIIGLAVGLWNYHLSLAN